MLKQRSSRRCFALEGFLSNTSLKKCRYLSQRYAAIGYQKFIKKCGLRRFPFCVGTRRLRAADDRLRTSHSAVVGETACSRRASERLHNIFVWLCWKQIQQLLCRFFFLMKQLHKECVFVFFYPKSKFREHQPCMLPRITT